KCADVLMHMMGHFRPYLTTDEKRELLEAIGRHRNRLVPLVVPVTLIRHYVRKYDVPYLERQVFLHPHPVELMLRNHV
ncbi:MAG TPA: YbgA family protein, partial [Candidatus Binatia bacterium]|nr:YbgA family protein [Candidatus Binatia bacterium]